MRGSLTIALLLWAAPVFAQSHPCDSPTNTPGAATITVGQQYTLSWCQPATEDGVTFKEYRNGAAGIALVPLSGTVSATGYRQYTVARTEAAVGPVTLELSAILPDGREGQKSAPFALTVLQRAPAAPTGLRVIP